MKKMEIDIEGLEIDIRNRGKKIRIKVKKEIVEIDKEMIVKSEKELKKREGKKLVNGEKIKRKVEGRKKKEKMIGYNEKGLGFKLKDELDEFLKENGMEVRIIELGKMEIEKNMGRNERMVNKRMKKKIIEENKIEKENDVMNGIVEGMENMKRECKIRRRNEKRKRIG